MPLKCYRKPNRSRPRRYTARDVGRLACTGLKEGWFTRAELLAALKECPEAGLECDCKKLEDLLELATTAIALGISVLTFFLPVTRILGWMARIPFLNRLLGLDRFLKSDFERLLSKPATLGTSKATLEGTLDFLKANGPELLQQILVKTL